MSRTLYLVACGAPLAARIGDGVREASSRGWAPVVIPTDSARAWTDGTEVGDVPVLLGHRAPTQARRIPPADAVAVVPMTFNTLTAWANGTANTYPLATLCAALGARVPAVAVPFAKHDLAGHPGWLASMAVLRYAGVRLVDPATGAVGAVEPVESGTGEQISNSFQWSWALDQLPPIPL